MLHTYRPNFASNTEFYGFIDSIRDKLKSSGFAEDAARLHELVHEMVWTTSSELFGELWLALKRIGRQRAGLPSDLSSDIRYAIRSINKASRRG
jgi:hypothetical protein